MKLQFTKKMILYSVETDCETTIIQFASFLKEDFFERLLKISVKNSTVTGMFLSSNEYGTATWTINRGFIDSHRWETDDDLNRISFLTRHYPAPLENGKVSQDYVFNKIVPDILDNMLDYELSFNLWKILKSPDNVSVFKWDEIIKKNRDMSDVFINNLIYKYETEIIELGKTEERPVLQTNKKRGGFLFDNIINPLLTNLYKLHKLKKDDPVITPYSSNKKDYSRELEDIKEYLERARKLSARIKKF